MCVTPLNMKALISIDKNMMNRKEYMKNKANKWKKKKKKETSCA
jgi:hypothetical protein